MPTDPRFEIPPADIPVIQDAALQVMMRAMELLSGRSTYAVGALSLALGSTAAMLKIPYAQLISMLSQHYENQLLDEIATATEGTGDVMLKKEDGDY